MAYLSTDVEPAWTSLRAQIEDWDAKRHAVRESQTSLKIQSRVVDNAVRVAHGAILDVLDRNRHSPKFLTFFPRGLLAVYSASYQDKLTIVRSIAETCTQESDPKILQQAELRRAAAGQMDAAFRRRSETRVAESAAYGQLQTRKIGAMDTCRRIGFHLTGRFLFNHDRVRTFFRVNYRQPSSPAPEFLGLSPDEAAFVEVKLALGAKVREERARLKLTRESLAKRLGSRQSRVAKREAGDPTVSLDLLVRALIALDTLPRQITKTLTSRKR